MKRAKSRILEGRKAEYAVLSALLADSVTQSVAPEYAGFFGVIAAFLTGG